MEPKLGFISSVFLGNFCSLDMVTKGTRLHNFYVSDLDDCVVVVWEFVDINPLASNFHDMHNCQCEIFIARDIIFPMKGKINRQFFT